MVVSGRVSPESGRPSQCSTVVTRARPAPLRVGHSPRGGTCTSGRWKRTAYASDSASASGQRGPSSLAQLSGRRGVVPPRAHARRPAARRMSTPSICGANGLLANPRSTMSCITGPQREEVVGGDEVHGPPHQRPAHDLLVFGHPRQLRGVELVEPAPEAGVGRQRHLRLHADQVLDRSGDADRLAAQQQLALQESAVEGAGGEQHFELRQGREARRSATARVRWRKAPYRW